ncbi:MAG: periplasmic heavy metal sensor [Chitinophagales bacterium]
MKKETLLTIAVVSLLLLNIGTLGYLVVNQNIRHPHFPPPGGGGPARLLVETLQLNEQQQKAFDDLKFSHRSSINKLDEQYNQLLVSYLTLLKQPAIDTVAKHALEEQMAAIQVQKADITIKHFEAVKQLCNEEQKRRFDEMIPELIQVLAAPKNQPPPPPGP